MHEQGPEGRYQPEPYGMRGKARSPVVSSGQLPLAERVRDIVAQTHQLFRSNTEGKVADYIPALARTPPHLFGLCVVGTDGSVHSAGDAEHQFTIQSVSKPFVFALVCQAIGEDEARAKLGANSTGLPFNSVIAIERTPGGTTNPMVNAGAIAATSLVPGASAEDKWDFIRQGLSRFAGRGLLLNSDVYESEAATNHRNEDIARTLWAHRRIYFDPMEATDVYTRQCALNVTAQDLAAMAATLANGGRNPTTRDQIVDPVHCRHALAVMVTAGLYEYSGDWLYETGLPGKSGVSGGMVAVSPGKCGLGTFAPQLDSAGNSVKGQLAAAFLADRLGLNLFASMPRT